MPSSFAMENHPATTSRSAGIHRVICKVMLGRLVEKMRRALSVRHLENGDDGLRITGHGVVRARGTTPTTAASRCWSFDGQEVGWDQFGRMLMTYEGWQFKLTIADKREEL